MLSDLDLLKQWQRDKQTAETQLAMQHKVAQEDHIFVAGDTMYYTGSVEQKGSRREVIFNKVKPYIDAVSGTMIQIRRKPEYNARLMDDQAMQSYSEYMNCLSDNFRKKANLDQVESLQDREMLITGYGAVDTNIGYENDPNGQVVAECLRFDDVFFDPLAQETNMLDGRFVYRRKPFSKEEAEERFSSVDIDEFESYTGMNEASQYYPDGGEYDKIQPGGVTELDLVQVNYYQWWELQPYWRVENPAKSIDDPQQQQEFVQMLGAIQESRYEASDNDDQEDLFEYKPTDEYLCLTPDQYSDVKRLCDEFGIKPKSVKQRKKAYYTALITDKTVLRKFKSPAQDGFTIKFKTANYDPVSRLWYGMVRTLKKPAEYANKAMTEMLYIIASTSKAGVLYEEDAVDDPRRFEEQYATTQAAIRVNSGTLSGGKIQPKGQPAMNTGYEAILQYSNDSLGEVSGISKEFLGTAQNKQVAALLESQRINQVLATLATYFDAISLYQLEHARMMVTFIRMLAQNSEGRLVRILGQDGAPRYEQMTEQRLVDEYDIDISEAPTTPAQREQTTQIMIDFADKQAAFGKDIYNLVVPYLPIKNSEKQTLLQALTPNPQMQQQQQQQKQQSDQLQMATMEAHRQTLIAKAGKDTADIPYLKAKTIKTIAESGHQKVLAAKDAAEITNTHADTHDKLASALQKKLAAVGMLQEPGLEPTQYAA